MEKLISSEIVFTCPVFKVEKAVVELPDGTKAERWYAVKNDAVGIVAINKAGEILLTREYRSASRDYRWRIPAGGLKDDESPEDGAHRELREETGLDASRMQLLTVKKSPSGWIKQSSHFFLASDLFESPLDSGEHEDLEVVATNLDDVQNKIEKGDLTGNIAEGLRAAIEILRST
ncbi:NUDIX hydrolase [Candidatus Woesebacteria bacterium]|nr:NUDIX hydrolase [Candidatus Woesebacteria bacterium]